MYLFVYKYIKGIIFLSYRVEERVELVWWEENDDKVGKCEVKLM